MISGPRRGPLLENPNELPLREVGPREIFRYVGNSKTAERGITHLKDVVKDHLSVHADIHFTSISFKLPGPQSAMRCLTQVDTRMCNEVLGVFGTACLAK